MIGRYIKNLLIAIDQLGNAITGGDPDETISSRIGKNPNASFLSRLLYKGLNRIQKNHCEDSVEADEGNN